MTDKAPRNVIVKYKVYLDDVRFPPDETWTDFKDPYECWEFIQNEFNNITHISLDHDLAYRNDFGEEVTWYDILTWILNLHYNYVRMDMGHGKLPEIIFHTANPVWYANMTAALNAHKKILWL